MSKDLQGSWFKSSYSTGATTCVEIRFLGNAVQIRDSKLVGEADEPILTVLSPKDWRAFLRAVGSDGYGRGGTLDCSPTRRRTVILRSAHGGLLEFPSTTWIEFIAGAIDGEFDHPEQRRWKRTLAAAETVAVWTGRAFLAYRILGEVESHKH